VHSFRWFIASGFSRSWAIDLPLLCTNDFSESGFRVSEKILKNREDSAESSLPE
jgi:hypothetical protein